MTGSHEVAGSNPASSTNKNKDLAILVRSLFWVRIGAIKSGLESTKKV